MKEPYGYIIIETRASGMSDIYWTKKFYTNIESAEEALNSIISDGSHASLIVNGIERKSTFEIKPLYE